MQGHRLYFDDSARRWRIVVPVALTRDQLRRICAWAIPIQEQRLRSVARGIEPDRHARCAASISALRAYAIDNVVVDADRDGVLTPFCSTVRSNESRKVFA